MTPRQKELVQLSFEQIKPMARATAALFYGRLVDLDPHLERLFRGDVEERGQRLINMIGLAVKGLNRRAELMRLLQYLGARNAGYGVRERDYETVGAALIWTLEHGLGNRFTVEVREAWVTVYEMFASAMRAGAREALVVMAVAPKSSSRRSAGACTDSGAITARLSLASKATNTV